MSAFTRLVDTARVILDEYDAARLNPRPDRPPIFVRTHWLFIEIDEVLAKVADGPAKIGVLSTRIKEARIANSSAEASRFTRELETIAKELAIVSFQLAQLSTWAREQFDRESPVENPNAD